MASTEAIEPNANEVTTTTTMEDKITSAYTSENGSHLEVTTLVAAAATTLFFCYFFVLDLSIACSVVLFV